MTSDVRLELGRPESIYKPEDAAILFTVPVAAGYDVGMMRVDCGENGEEARYSIGSEGWPDREPLGYESPHFALPAFRWTEFARVRAFVEELA